MMNPNTKMDLRVHYFRHDCFASNSSSTHSMLLIASHMVGKIKDRLHSGADQGAYGWENFVLASTEQKIRYLIAQLVSRFRGSPENMEVIARHFQQYYGGKEAFFEKIDSCFENYVDHQSVMKIGDTLTDDLVQQLLNLFTDPRIVICGGNDNDDGNPSIPPHNQEIPILTEDTSFGLRMDGKYIVMFDRNHGSKVRISLGSDAPEYTKSTYPELVDLKITDWCDAGCKFCYQGSTPKGKHASLKTIERILDMLVEMSVFEVAIGGGEPTAHPDFAKILKMITERGMIPNFTTYSMKWVDDADIFEAVHECCRGIGVSCLNVSDVEKANNLYRKTFSYNVSRPKVTAHHVFGSVPMQKTVEIIEAASRFYIPLLLLGFKETGFGKTYRRHDDDVTAAPMLKLCLENQGHMGGLMGDTAFVDNHPEIIKMLDIANVLIASPEGKFSCYVDACAMKMAASSYVDPDTMDDLPTTLEAFVATYAKY